MFGWYDEAAPEAAMFNIQNPVSEGDRIRRLVSAGFIVRTRSDANIAERTRNALAATKARGKALGNPNGAAALRRAAKGNADAVRAVKAAADCHATKLAPVVAVIRAAGATSLASYADALNDRGILTPRGGRWHPSSVQNLLTRLSRLS